MSDIKCPVCNQPLHDDHDGFYSCYSDNCCVSGGTLDTWQELIRTRKALEIAVDALKDMNEIIKNYEYGNGLYYALDGHDTMLIAEDVEKALYQIKALEQKE